MPIKFDNFIFRGFEFDEASHILNMRYSLDNSLNFTEKIKFDFDFDPDFNRSALSSALNGLWLMSGISYYKAFLPKNIKLDSVSLNSGQKEFFDETYRLGLAQFFYQNRIDPNGLANFPADFGATSESVRLDNLKGTLVPMGGGKDSVSTAGILAQKKEPYSLWLVGNFPALNPLLDKIGNPVLRVSREIDPELLIWNQKGAWNGHVPISAILSFLSIASAILTNRKTVLFSNDRSTEEPSIVWHDLPVNHQHSKTLQFEKSFQKYVRDNISPDIEYASFLRPLSALKISEIFCRDFFKIYRKLFSSCNSNFHLNRQNGSIGWCGKCSKCAYIFLAFSPFLPKQDLMTLFDNKNLFQESKLSRVYSELLGLSGFKPLDCVGSMQENLAAASMAVQSGAYPELINWNCPPPSSDDWRLLGAHSLPDKWLKILTEYIRDHQL